MYLEHFGMAVEPFSLSPKLDFLYETQTFQESSAHLAYGVTSSEALVMITGPIGTGKTMAVYSFLSRLGSRYSTALITNTRVTGQELLKLILEDLGADVPVGADKSDLLILFKNYLIAAGRESRNVLVIIDEAQNLSVDALEEIRLLTNMGQGEAQPVQLFLVGQPELEDLVARPELAQLRQRIRVHYRLEPMTRAEVEEYVNHRVGVSGCSDLLFDSGALDLVHRFSRGVPRLVNALAGNALLSAYVADRRRVLAEDVDPQELPRSEASASRPTGAELVPPVRQDEPYDLVEQVLSDARKNVDPVPTTPPRPPAPPAVENRRQTEETTGPVRVIEDDTAQPVRRRRRPAVILVSVIAVMILAVIGFLGWGPGLDMIAKRLERGVQPSLPADSIEVIDAAPVESSAAQPAVAEVSHVELEEMPSEPATDTNAEQTTELSGEPSGEYVVHVASFRVRGRADALQGKLQNRVESVSVQKVEVRGTIWYRVLIGPYATAAQARRTAEDLQASRTINYFSVKNLGHVSEG